MATKRNLKARPKASPSRIQQNIHSQQAIVTRAIVDNTIQHIAETEDLNLNDLPSGDISVPLNVWLEHKSELRLRSGITAVQIGADENPEGLLADLVEIDIIVLPFVTHTDGRSYSIAHKLRERYNFTGQIRAIGDVKFDQLDFLTRVGCDAFELPEGENLETALRAFTEFSDVYQPAADKRSLIFSRRRTLH